MTTLTISHADWELLEAVPPGSSTVIPISSTQFNISTPLGGGSAVFSVFGNFTNPLSMSSATWLATASGTVTSMTVAIDGIVQLNATGLTISLSEILNDAVDKIHDVIQTVIGDSALILGSGEDDHISGNGGDDSISGGHGNDDLFGDLGDDSLSGGSGNDHLFGEAGDDSLSGGDGDDSLSGGNGNDRLYAGTGTDTLNGGSGNDYYYVDSSADFIVESTGSGTDTEVASFSDTLDANIENLVLTGSAALNGTGNVTNNVITGNSGTNTLSGGQGDDRLKGGQGKDTLDGGAGIDSADFSDKTAAVVATLNGATAVSVSVGGIAEDSIKNIENLSGGSSSDTLNGDGLSNALSGNSGDDNLNGLSGNDVLKGGQGKDTLDGGSGNDTADYSDKTTAVVATLNGATSASVSVGGVAEDNIKSIENLSGGSSSDTLNGDGLSNSLSGNSGDDNLNGLSGNDVLKGGQGKDTLDGGVGIDSADFSDKTAAVVVTLNGATAVSVLVGGVAEDNIKNIENLSGGSSSDTLNGDGLSNSLTGNSGDDNLNGLSGNDVLKGGLGKDILDGGAGTDSADFSDKTAAVVATLNGATAITVTIGGVAEDNIKNIENLSGGSSSDTLNGDGLSNSLTGNSGDDNLNGLSGNDLLRGGLGNDILYGGAGQDIFRFDTALSRATNLDQIADFSVADDTIQLSKSIFSKFGTTTTATIDSANIKVDATGLAGDNNDYIVYETDTGKLFYDADGSGAGASVQIALLGTNLALTNADFFLV